jgi:BirA family biotin operon repressor/biotin-[acetyl-CoA-carboxylase] ligase
LALLFSLSICFILKNNLLLKPQKYAILLDKSPFSTLFIGQNLIKLDSIPSTNTYASRLLDDENPPEGTIILANNQEQGKGQQGAKWESAQGKNLTFSIILYPRFLKPTEQFLLNEAISIGICEFIRNISQKETFIKWSNDILVDNHKIAGILIENSLRGDKINSTIVGIGININQIIFSRDSGNPISLKQLTGIDFDLMDCLKSVCSYIEVHYLELQNIHKRASLDSKYLDLLWNYNQKVRYFEGKIEKSGTIIGITPEGKLKIRDEEGIIFTYNNKEVRFVL